MGNARLVGQLGEARLMEAAAIRLFQVGDGGARRLDEGVVFALGRGLGGALLSRAQRQIAAKHGRREERLKPIIITLRQRLELVERQAGGVRHVVERVLPPQGRGRGVGHVRTEEVEAGRGQGVGLVRKQLIARQLFLHEAVERLVAVEGTHDVIAVAPGVGPHLVVLVPVALGVARDVEPVATPALAVVRRRE